MMGNSDNRIIVPITTGQRVLKVRTPRQYYFKAENKESVDAAQTAVEALFKRKLKDDSNYMIINQSQLLSVVNSAMSTLTNMLAGIAAISLLVGGVGIMNIMLVSVTERTREIGIRKAIGAKRRDVLLQFLIESAFISVLGGLVGLALSTVALTVVGSIIDIAMPVSGRVIALALGFSALIGIAFGLYPANRAAKLNPIDALRYE